MNTRQQSLQELQQIKRMMERSSKFISLSGLSGISAGICAFTGAWFASQKISSYNSLNTLQNDLLLIALLTFVVAFNTTLGNYDAASFLEYSYSFSCRWIIFI